jgi:uroporphyrinogen-III synthase
MTSLPLQNCTIVVTRPTAQAARLIKALEDAGATVIHFPVIEITAPPDQDKLREQAKQLNTYDMAIFISRNAVIYGSALIRQTAWPASIQIAAIGEGTAQQLHEQGMTVDIVANGIANSESLLNTESMENVAGKRILIFRGNGGKEKLADNLLKRGATVDYLECYERNRPNNNTEILSELWRRKAMNGIILTSSEGLKNLYDMVKKEDFVHLNTTPLYVISSTMVELCGKLGYKLTPVLMPSAANEDVMQSLLNNCTTKM